MVELNSTQGLIALAFGALYGLALGGLLPFVTIGHLSKATPEAYQRRASSRIAFGALIVHYATLLFWALVTETAFQRGPRPGFFWIVVVPPVMSYCMMHGYRLTHRRALSFFPPVVDLPDSERDIEG